MYVAIFCLVLLYIFGIALAVYNLKNLIQNKKERIKARRAYKKKHKSLWYRAVKEELERRKKNNGGSFYNMFLTFINGKK